MAGIDRADPSPPSCVQEIGYRGHPKACGEPARYGLAGRDGSGPPIAMCEFHALLAMDRTGATIAVEWAPPPGPSRS